MVSRGKEVERQGSLRGSHHAVQFSCLVDGEGVGWIKWNGPKATSGMGHSNWGEGGQFV
jgi:hypothetical protein